MKSAIVKSDELAELAEKFKGYTQRDNSVHDTRRRKYFMDEFSDYVRIEDKSLDFKDSTSVVNFFEKYFEDDETRELNEPTYYDLRSFLDFIAKKKDIEDRDLETVKGEMMGSLSEKIVRYEPSDVRDKILTSDQIEDIFSECDQFQEMVIRLYLSGLRPGEVGGLKVEDINFEAHSNPATVSVERKASQSGISRDKVKTREVPISFLTRDIIKSYMVEKGLSEDSFLVPSENKDSYLRRKVKSVLEEVDNLPEGFKPKDIRFNAAVRLKQRGVSFAETKDILGGSSKISKEIFESFRKPSRDNVY